MLDDACHGEGATTPVPVAVKFKNDVAEFEMRLNSLATARALPGVPFPRFRPIQSPGIYPIPGELDPSLFDTMDPKLMLAAAALAAVVVADDGTVVGVGDDLPGLAKALEMFIRGLRGAYPLNPTMQKSCERLGLP